MSIEINPAHKGLLHKNLHVGQKKRLTATELSSAKHSKDPAVRKRAQFAINARKWAHHGKSPSNHGSKLYGAKK